MSNNPFKVLDTNLSNSKARPAIIIFTLMICYFLLFSKTIGIILTATIMCATINYYLIIWYVMGIIYTSIIIRKIIKQNGRGTILTFGFFLWGSWLIQLKTHEYETITSFVTLQKLNVIEFFMSFFILSYIIITFKSKGLKYFLEKNQLS